MTATNAYSNPSDLNNNCFFDDPDADDGAWNSNAATTPTWGTTAATMWKPWWASIADYNLGVKSIMTELQCAYQPDFVTPV